VIVTRHPVATCLATLKWTEGNIFSLLSHWVHCYRIARSDAAHLSNVIWTSYEAFVADPESERNRILRFAGLEPCATLPEPVRNENDKYFAQWQARYVGDGDRAILQVPPEHKRGLITRARERVGREKRERALPAYRRKPNLRSFYDGLDAASYLESAIAEFGYSFSDLRKMPVPQREMTEV
jgi:hypothetical protein